MNRLEHFFEIGPLNKVDIHVPDKIMTDHGAYWKNDGTPLYLKDRYGTIKGTEGMRETVLDHYRRAIVNREKRNRSRGDKIYHLTQSIFYYILFTMCGGRVNRAHLQFIGAIALAIAMMAVYQMDSADQGEFLSVSFKRYVPVDHAMETFIDGVELIQQDKGLNERIAEWMESNQEKETSRILKGVQPHSTLLAHGYYGAICHPPLCNIDPVTKTPIYHTNRSVSKLYYRESNANKAVKNIDQLQTIMAGIPNNAFKGQRHTLRRHGNLGNSLFTSFSKSKAIPMKKTDPLHAILLPHLGKSIDYVLKSKEEIQSFRSCDFHVIMGQLLKCQTILDRLASKQYLHGDISSPNMMWNKDKCSIHIIDFDWLLPYHDFLQQFKFGHPRNPPEALLMINDMSTFEQMKESWVTDNAYMFKYECKARYAIESVNHTEIVKQLLPEINATLEDLTPSGLSKVEIAKLSFPSFDSYAYAHVLLNLFAVVYPGSLQVVSKREFLHSLAQHLTQHGNPYSQGYLSLIGDTLLRIIDLYQRMGDFRVKHRVNAQNGLEEMNVIYKDFMRQHDALMGATVEDEAKKDVENTKPNTTFSLADLEFLTHEMTRAQNKKGGRRTAQKRGTKKKLKPCKGT